MKLRKWRFGSISTIAFVQMVHAISDLFSLFYAEEKIAKSDPWETTENESMWWYPDVIDQILEFLVLGRISLSGYQVGTIQIKVNHKSVQECNVYVHNSTTTWTCIIFYFI